MFYSAGILVVAAAVLVGIVAFAAVLFASAIFIPMSYGGPSPRSLVGWMLLGLVLAAFAPTLLAAIARMQEFVARGAFDLAIPRHVRPRHSGLVFRWASPLAERRNWRGFAHAVTSGLLGLLLIAAVGIATAAIALLATVATGHPASFAFIINLPTDEQRAFTILGITLVVSLVFTCGTILAHLLLTPVLLVPSEAETLRAQAAVEQRRRAQAVQAADIERDRLERDLHDGVQPQLVSIAMTLGLAQRKFDTDPAAAKALLAEALAATRTTTADLRALVRGLRPAILADRGLDAALSALAAGSAIPVRITSHLGERLDRQAELVLYFAISEAIGNAVKHSGATQITVAIRRVEQDVRAEIRDNGRGGAVATPGGGIVGLADRVGAAGGQFTMSSPIGGPTVIEVTVPCES